MNKFIVLVSFSNFLGGAQIRYLSLFKEINKRKNDYFLIVNRKLFDIAYEAGYLDQNNKKIIILEIDKKSIKQFPENQNNNVTKKLWLKTKLKKASNGIISVKKLIQYSYKLHQVFKQCNPNYVYAIWIGGMIAWSLKYIHKFKFVYSYMDSGFSSLDTFWKHPLKCERIPLRQADIIDFLSADLFKGIQQKVKLSEKTKISITPSSFKNYNNIQSAKLKTNTVTFCSRMTAIKNPILLLESIVLFNRTYKYSKDINFQFLGSGECLIEMREFKKTHNLSNVELLGTVNNPIVYLSKSKIFVSIQQTNNYPSQSLLEAMACENAIIASDVGETRKIVTDKEGILVHLNVHEISKAIMELFENEKKCKQLGTRARQKVLSEHTIERYMEYFYSLEKI